MLKLYTDKRFLTETYRRKVFPLLFDLAFTQSKVVSQYYKIEDEIEISNIVVFPVDYVTFLKHKVAFSKLRLLAKRHQKPIWIYTAGDYGFTNYIKNSYTFRLGGFNSKLDDKTFIIPSFINDPYDVYLQQGFSALKKGKKPSIGFVGHAQLGFIKYLKEYSSYLKHQIKRKLGMVLADNQSFYPSSIKRAHYLNKLASNAKLNSQFVFRGKYRAGMKSKDSQKQSSQIFYDNIFNNAYTFCSRGVGNFSVRFYETLAAGRIPILLNTDCRLPLYNKIEWSQHGVILDELKEESLEDQILNFHNSKTEEEFEILQQSNRDLWHNYLRRDTFFKEVHNNFINKEV